MKKLIERSAEYLVTIQGWYHWRVVSKCPLGCSLLIDSNVFRHIHIWSLSLWDMDMFKSRWSWQMYWAHPLDSHRLCFSGQCTIGFSHYIYFLASSNVNWLAIHHMILLSDRSDVERFFFFVFFFYFDNDYPVLFYVSKEKWHIRTILWLKKVKKISRWRYPYWASLKKMTDWCTQNDITRRVWWRNAHLQRTYRKS